MKIVTAGLGLFSAVMGSSNSPNKPMLDGTENFLQNELEQNLEPLASITELPIEYRPQIDFDEALAPLSIFHTPKK